MNAIRIAHQAWAKAEWEALKAEENQAHSALYLRFKADRAWRAYLTVAVVADVAG